MDVRPLPDRPDLEQYKKQAKDLLTAWHAGDREARARVSARHPHPMKVASTLKLADAQVVLAREHGFDSWPAFAGHVRSVATPSDVARFEEAVEAVIAGDLATLERLVGAAPGLVRARSTRAHRATLLHYVGANGVEDYRQRTPTNAVAVATLLLDRGADVNARADMYGGSDTLGLVATSMHPLNAGVQEDLLTLLLSRGATVAGAAGGAASSSVINACLANGRPGAAEFLARRIDRLDLEAASGLGRLDVVKTFFDQSGALANGATGQQMTDGFSWACEYGRTEVVDFLLRHGMEAGARLRPHQQTGLHWAAFGGHDETVRVLLARHPPLDARDASFDGTPLGWALYAWGGGREQSGGGRYYDVVEQLVAAGATVADEWLNESDRGFPLARRIGEDARMRSLLAGRAT